MEKLPYDINYEIIRKSHPYYSLPLCESDKQLLLQCERTKYELMQIWIAPDLTIKEIRDKYSNLTFKDVVLLSLVYNPIPESIGHYDRITLFYHACHTNQFAPEQYLILDDEYRLITYIDIIANICYKFNRIDVIDRIANIADQNEFWSKAFRVMSYRIQIKNGERVEPIIPETTKKDNIAIHRIMESSLILEPDEIFEYILIDAKLGINIALQFVNYLQTGNITNMPVDQLADSLAYIIGKQNAGKLLQSYFPGRSEDEPNNISPNVGNSLYPANIYVLNSSLNRYFSDNLFYQLRFNKSGFDAIIADKYKGIYYITSGNYLDYVTWKRKGYQLTDEGTYKYFTIAPWGIASINADIVKLYPEISLNYPIGGSGYNNPLREPFTKSV